MKLPISSPHELVKKHTDVVVISLVFFIIGFLLGFGTPLGQTIIEDAQKQHVEPAALSANFIHIMTNNGLIGFFTWIGWVLVVPMGYFALPPYIMVYSIGAAFGAVIHYSGLQSIFLLLSFGILEAGGFILTLSAGLMFLKWLLYKLTKKEKVTFTAYSVDSASFFLYGFLSLFSAAALESLLIHPAFTWIAVVGGLIVTFFAVKMLVTD